MRTAEGPFGLEELRTVMANPILSSPPERREVRGVEGPAEAVACHARKIEMLHTSPRGLRGERAAPPRGFDEPTKKAGPSTPLRSGRNHNVVESDSAP